MTYRARLSLALAAVVEAVWVEATLVRHWAGVPNTGIRWLLLSPALGALIVLIGVAAEAVPSLGRLAARLAVGMQLIGLALLSWRSLWMFFSWDGMLIFPVWCLAALAMWKKKPRVADVA